MPFNKKKPIRLVNRTKYFDETKDKTHVRFGSPLSYQSRRIKIEGYETRLYWHFRYCLENDGQTFYYTLTYNDRAVPNHYGVNCFDYEDLRDLLTGGFRKQLLRKYGTVFKYFVGAELGDGKGSRGLHNNPHYHILFFLEPDPDAKFPYEKISSEDFRHLVRLYWQGFDQDKEPGHFHDFREAKYGVAKEGEDCGLVKDFRACMYCAKYVCKDAHLKQHESEVEKKVRFQLKKDLLWAPEMCFDFLHEVLYPLYNTPLNSSQTEWLYSDSQLIPRLLDGHYSAYFDMFGEVPESVINLEISSDIRDIVEYHHLTDIYMKFFNDKIEEKVTLKINEWRNRFSNKCRISQGVGDYALKHIDDKMNPSIQVPSKQGFKNRPISQYYYRKLYTKVYHPEYITRSMKLKKFPPIRVLNDFGIKYKVSRLDSQLKKRSSEASGYLTIVSGNKILYDKMLASDVNTNVFMDFSDFQKEFYLIRKEYGYDEIIKRYAEYKLVYEDRWFKVPSDGSDIPSDFPPINVSGDYGRFLKPSVYSVSRSDLRLCAFLEDSSKGYLPYCQHPYFLRFIRLFAVLDLCADYFFVQKDDKEQLDAEEIANVKRFHDKQKLEEFYHNFK